MTQAQGNGQGQSRDHQIKNTTSLDNITNEIKNLLSSPNANSSWYRSAIKDCLNVINKAESENLNDTDKN